MSLNVLELQSGEPLTLEEAKTQLVISHDLDDDYIQSLIVVATRFCETYCQRHFVRKSVEETFKSFDKIDLDRPVVALTSVAYRDVEGAWQVLDPLDYDLVDDKVFGVVGGVWPCLYQFGNAVKVVYEVGHANGLGDVPNQYIGDVVRVEVKHAMKLIVTHLYEMRGAVTDKNLKNIPFGVEALLSDSRMVRI